MARKPHLIFKNKTEGKVEFKPLPRGGGKKSEDEEEKNYTPKREDFIRSRDGFLSDREIRVSKRNVNLNIPLNIEFIQIHFHDSFDSSSFENKYRSNFGLSVSSYSDFNTVGLFAVVDRDLFNSFLDEINKFINTTNHYDNVTYNTDIKFIKEFSFHTTEKIIKFGELKPHVILNIVDNVDLFKDYIQPIESSLIGYLRQNEINFFVSPIDNKIELLEIEESKLIEIADNFDIIQSINSYTAGVIRPGSYNLPERSFGFNITNFNADLPIIGVIDTGISNNTPLSQILINDGNEFDLTGTAPFIDSFDHGTAVGTLASLGDRLFPNHIGDFEADAKLLSIKVLDSGRGYIPESEVVRLIKEAHDKYGVKIFTLTIGYQRPKKYNEIISEYASALDNLSFELNILIFISVGNNSNLQHYDGRRFVTVSYPNHFDSEDTNLFTPAESMNNITIGAAAGNFENNEQVCISPDSLFPAIYTRTHYINWLHHSINWTRINKQLFKPDICQFAGDYDDRISPELAGLKVLSSQEGLFFNREIGTSYAGPLVANIAAKLLKQYPSLSHNMQTVKALIINGANNNKLDEYFKDLQNVKLQSIYGNGIPNVDTILQSDDNNVTFVLEDTISHKKIMSYELKLPEYLLDVSRQNGVLHIDATLCFKFKPVPYNQLAYCPIHISFGIFRNLSLEEFEIDEKGEIRLNSEGKAIPIGINGNKTVNYVFSESWAQDYYYKAKMLSNSQKISFNISKKVLEEEKCTLKIALNAVLHKLLSPALKEEYNLDYPFSLVFTIRENSIKGENTNRLYNELIALNEAIPIVEADANLEIENLDNDN